MQYVYEGLIPSAKGCGQWQWGITMSGCNGKAVLHDFVQDPDGSYIARWVPELARLPKKHLHQPWAAPAEVLAAAGVKFGSAPGCYPPRITTAVLQVRPTACHVHAKLVQLPSQIPWCRACCYSTQG